MRLFHLTVTLASAVAIILAVVKPNFIPLPWYARAVLLVVGAGLGGYAVQLTDETEKQRALKHMEGRQPLTDAEFGCRFFPPQQVEIAARLRTIMARHISVDLSRLHPDDLIVEDIRMDALDSLSTVEFVLEVEKEFGVSIPNAAAEKMRTLKDVIEFVSQAKKDSTA